MAPKERYGYAVARLRALENRLLDESVLQRMIDCDTLEAAVKVLGETPYSPWLMELKSPLEFDKAIESELQHCYAEVGTFVPDGGLVALLRLVYDVHNVKTLLKSQFLTASGEKRRLDLLTALGNIDTDKLVLAIEGEEYWELPYGFNQAVLIDPHELIDIKADFGIVNRVIHGIGIRSRHRVIKDSGINILHLG